MMAPAPVLIAKAKKKAIGIIRVSTKKQDMARQIADLHRLAKKYDLEIVEIIEFEGLSGRKVRNNAKFLQFLNGLAQRPDVAGIVLSAIDRFFRTDRYSDTSVFEPLVDHKKMIWSVVEGDVEPWTDAGFTTCMGAALTSGKEWRELRRRTVDGKRELAEAGILPHSNAWFGVDIIGRKKTGVVGAGYAVLNEFETAIVREVFLTVKGGSISTYAVAADLNNRGILSKGHNGKPPAQWSRKTILQMLENKSYIGQHLWGDIVIPVPRIIDDETFYTVRAMMQARAKVWAGQPSRLYLLRRFIHCARCGHPMQGKRGSGSSKNPKLFYRCGHATNKPPVKRLCNACQISAEVLEREAWGAIWGMLKDPALLLEMGHNHYATQSNPNLELTGKIGAELKRLAQKDRNLTKSIEEAATDEECDEQRAKRRELRATIAGLEAQLRTANRVVNLPPLSALEAHVRRITTGAEPETYDERRDILEGLDNLRMDYADGDLKITGEVAVSDVEAAAGLPGKKCQPLVHPDGNSYQPIPFILKRRVA
jgi:DNA invertase Pin-like site-specific DNA recombinase